MQELNPEQKAREIINILLAQAGWVYKEEEYIPGSREGRAGFADYSLYDLQGTAIALLEAKEDGKHPLVGKEQARKYAESLNRRYVILSNGARHYVWDTETGNPKPVISIPSPEELVAPEESEPVRDRTGLWTTPAESVFPDRREQRGYQIDAVRAIQNEAQNGRTSFLLELATGTGKTTIASTICRLYISTENAQHILFLVDRIELRGQASTELDEIFNGQYKVGEYTDSTYNWNEFHITVATVQTIASLFSNPGLINPRQFDLIITDEAHRCISGPEHRALFEGFDAEKIGLTATPRTMLTPENLSDTDLSPTSKEARALRDTYQAFGLEPGTPTFSYTIEQAIEDGYLVGPIAVDTKTDVTARMMSDEGYQVTIEDYETGESNTATYRIQHYENTFKSDGTNRQFCEEYIKEALREPGNGVIGKGIIYAVSQSHAAELTNGLNEQASELWPGVYQSDFAVQITSDVHNANEFGKAFKNNNLRGNYPRIDNYRTSKTRVCVTVAMMTTGYDCPDLLNIGLCRPVKSPTDFTQIKGRGTRRFDFRENITDPIIKANSVERLKNRFKIIDFFGNCQYHQEAHLYQPRVQPIQESTNGDGSGEKEPNGRSAYIRHGEDEIESRSRLEFASDAATITRRQEDPREQIIRAREITNETIGQAFNEYLSAYPMDNEFHRGNARAVFEAYALYPEVRALIDNLNFAALDGTSLQLRQFTGTPTEHRTSSLSALK